MMRSISAVLLIAMLTACASTGQGQRQAGSSSTPASVRPVYNLTGYSSAFKDGYIDGCEMAKKSAYGRKDAGRISADTQYRLGWNDGFSLCSGKR
jgi:hypothetical protein